MISFTCSCGKTLHAREENAGDDMCCPECGRTLVVPRAEPVADQPTEAVKPAPDPLRLPICYERRPAASILALASFFLGGASVLLGFLAPPIWAMAAGLTALCLGVVALWAVLSSQGRKKGMGFAVTGLVAGLLGLVGWPVAAYFINEKTEELRSSNNLKLIGLCMHDYQDVNGGLPPVARCDAAGTPLLSWRVLILPYVAGFGEANSNLFPKFKLDEPWDGPNNSKLLSQMPRCYALPGSRTDPPGYTHYRVFVGNGAAFDPPAPASARGLNLSSDFPDGAADTILVVEAAEAVPWTKPDELAYDPKTPLPPLGGRFRGGFHATLADGSVRWVGSNVSEQTLRAAITRAGNDAPGPDW